MSESPELDPAPRLFPPFDPAVAAALDFLVLPPRRAPFALPRVAAALRLFLRFLVGGVLSSLEAAGELHQRHCELAISHDGGERLTKEQKHTRWRCCCGLLHEPDVHPCPSHAPMAQATTLRGPAAEPVR